MGTNYYHKITHDGPERHIGKDSAGWQFTFRGYARMRAIDQPQIKSWEDWKAEILKHGIVVDEYGKEIEIPDFIRTVENTKRRRHPNMGDGLSWPDPEGWEFTLTEFC